MGSLTNPLYKSKNLFESQNISSPYLPGVGYSVLNLYIAQIKGKNFIFQNANVPVSHLKLVKKNLEFMRRADVF